MNSDGGARWGYTDQQSGLAADPPEAPFCTRWSILNGRDLLIEIPIPPMPEYEIEEWELDASTIYDIMMVEEDYMLLSDRPFDGEFITLFQRYI